jgi:hypothetical protein
MIFDFDDFGGNHVISNMCQSRDCRKELDILHGINPAFKVTLFAIPDEMTRELLDWCKANEAWVELGVHGIKHTSNYEFEKITYQEVEDLIYGDPSRSLMLERYFKKLFKAPGWQISDDAFKWLQDAGWMVADQSYNDARRPGELKTYVNDNGNFIARPNGSAGGFHVEAWHGHVWNCVGNGIEETFEQVKSLVENAKNFEFVTEILQ